MLLTNVHKIHLPAAKPFPFLSKLNETLDDQAVKAKLASSSKASMYSQRNTAVFGIEDINGRIIKVSVPTDQRDEFQAALQRAVSDAQMQKDVSNIDVDVAELLFVLRRSFDIIDVMWPDVAQEDEESQIEQVTSDEESDESLEDSDEESEDAPPVEDTEDASTDEEDMSGDEPVSEEMPPEADQVSANDILTRVLDVMSQQAAAEQAKASADKAKYARDIATARLRQEEQLLDAEAFAQAEKDRKKESAKMLKLAKFRDQIKNNPLP